MRTIGEWLNPIISSGEFVFILVVVALVLYMGIFALMCRVSSRIYHD